MAITGGLRCPVDDVRRVVGVDGPSVRPRATHSRWMGRWWGIGGNDVPARSETNCGLGRDDPQPGGLGVDRHRHRARWADGFHTGLLVVGYYQPDPLVT